MDAARLVCVSALTSLEKNFTLKNKKNKKSLTVQLMLMLYKHGLECSFETTVWPFWPISLEVLNQQNKTQILFQRLSIKTTSYFITCEMFSGLNRRPWSWRAWSTPTWCACWVSAWVPPSSWWHSWCLTGASSTTSTSTRTTLAPNCCLTGVSKLPR